MFGLLCTHIVKHGLLQLVGISGHQSYFTSETTAALSCLPKKHKVCSSRQSDVKSPDLGVKYLYLHSPKIIPSISYKNL